MISMFAYLFLCFVPSPNTTVRLFSSFFILERWNRRPVHPSRPATVCCVGRWRRCRYRWSDLVENGPVRTSCNSLRFQQVLKQKLRKLIFFKLYEPLICSKFGRWLESSNFASSRTQLNDTWLNVKMNY